MINKKIKNLTNIFLKDYSEKLNIIKNNKIDKKSSMFWLIVILIFCLTYISVYVISHLNKLRVPELALKIYFPIVAVFMTFQLIILVCNIFFYSKDLEYVLPLPVKPIEILISKLFTIIFIMYTTEAVFLVIPLLMYEILVAGTIRFFIYSIFALAVFPIFYTLIIAILTLIIMKFLKKIKNENIIQLIIILILTIFLMSGVFVILSKNINELQNAEQVEIVNERLENINKYFVITNPITELLTQKNILKNIINIIKIILFEGILFFIFYILGKKIYFDNLLKIYRKNTVKKKKQYKYKKTKKEKIYLKNELRKIFRNTTYFTQTVYNYISVIIIALFLINTIIPICIQEIQADTTTSIEQLKLQLFCIVLATTQIISTFNNLAITAISKEGKEAYFIKYIPISLYKQFKMKVIPQIITNILMTVSVLIVIFINTSQISFVYYIITFITATILNIIYSYCLLLLDCRKPNLNWTNEESITKNNNKIYKYFITIIFVLILIYFTRIFEEVKFIFAILIMNIFFLIILIFLDRYIKKNINKVFDKIY